MTERKQLSSDGKNILVEFINSASACTDDYLASPEFGHKLIHCMDNNTLENFDVLGFIEEVLNLKWFPVKYMSFLLLVIQYSCDEQVYLVDLKKALTLLFNDPRRGEMLCPNEEFAFEMARYVNPDSEDMIEFGKGGMHAKLDHVNFVKTLYEKFEEHEHPSVFSRVPKNDITEIAPIVLRRLINEGKPQGTRMYLMDIPSIIFVLEMINRNTDDPESFQSLYVPPEDSKHVREMDFFRIKDKNVHTYDVVKNGFVNIEQYEKLGINQVYAYGNRKMVCSPRFLAAMISGVDIYKQSDILLASIRRNDSYIREYVMCHIRRYGNFCKTIIPSFSKLEDQGGLVPTSVMVTALHLFGAIALNHPSYDIHTMGICKYIPTIDRLQMSLNKRRKIEKEIQEEEDKKEKEKN